MRNTINLKVGDKITVEIYKSANAHYKNVTIKITSVSSERDFTGRLKIIGTTTQTNTVQKQVIAYTRGELTDKSTFCGNYSN